MDVNTVKSLVLKKQYKPVDSQQPLFIHICVPLKDGGDRQMGQEFITIEGNQRGSTAL